MIRKSNLKFKSSLFFIYQIPFKNIYLFRWEKDLRDGNFLKIDRSIKVKGKIKKIRRRN